MLNTDNDGTVYSTENYYKELMDSMYLGPQLRGFEQHFINDNDKVYFMQYKQFDILFYDFYIRKDGEDIFLGRYLRNIARDIKVKLNDKMLLLYESDTRGRVAKVINLYYINDVIAFVGTEKEALNAFDPSIDSSDLENPNGSLVDYTANNRMKKTKNLTRFQYYGD